MTSTVDTPSPAAHPPGSHLHHPPKMDREAYESTLHDLQVELVKMQYWVRDTGERLLLLFEGRDTAGKGGTILRFREHLNPRSAPHVALPVPSDIEKTQWYFQRYIAHLPSAGEIVFYDRSWYNRAGVEKVMGFCTPEQYARFMRQVTPLEQSLVDEGIRLFKMYLAVNKDEQHKRLRSRKKDPLKSWKLSPMDEKAPDLFDLYTEAQNDMFLHTHTHEAPWFVINSNDKRTARVNAIRHVLAALPYADKDDGIAAGADPTIVGTPRDLFPDIYRAEVPE